jgi:hypothetical protein
MKFKFIFLLALLFGFQMVMAQYPNPNQSNSGQYSNQNEQYTHQNHDNAPMYSIRYKGLRCNKPQEKTGDELTVYLLGISADFKITNAMSMPVDSVLYENVKKGTVQLGPIATVFKGYMNQEVTIFCAIMERDAEESQKKTENIARWSGFVRNGVTTAAQVQGLTKKPANVAPEPTPNGQQEATDNQPNTNDDNSNQNNNYPNNNNGQGLRDKLPTLGGNNQMNTLQKSIVATEKATELTQDFLFRRSEKRGDIINKVFFPMEKVDIQEYLKAERKVVDNIKHHFTIQIKDNDADYDLFFEVIQN